MPFTGSHVAAVLPVLRSGLVPAALVIGSMVPDLPYYLPVPFDAGMTHSPAGTVTVDVVLGCLVMLVWQSVLARYLAGMAPEAVRARLAFGTQWTVRRVALVPVSVAVGAATHTVWDAFTHAGRWGPRHVAWLAQTHAGMPGHRWAQYISGVAGAIVIAVWLVRWWRATPPATPAVPAGPKWTVVAVGAACAFAGAGSPEGVLRSVFLAGTWGVGGALTAATLLAIVQAVRTGPAAARSAPPGYVAAGSAVLDDRRLKLWTHVAVLPVLVLSGYALFALVAYLRPGQRLDVTFRDPADALPFLAAVAGALLVTPVIVFAAHEALHGVILWLYTRDRPRFGFNGWYLYASAPGWYLPRNGFLLAALTPLIGLTGLAAGLALVLPPVPAGLVLIGAALNVSGSLGDVYLCVRLAPAPASTVVEDRPDGIVWHVSGDRVEAPPPVRP